MNKVKFDYKKKEDEKVSLIVENALYPVYYKQFQCLAADCSEDCCHGWRIEFNKKDYLSLRREDAPPELQKRLHDAVHRLRNKEIKKDTYAGFQMDENGRCPLQDPDGLCALQKACGHDALPFVCTSYPRSEKYTSVAKEYSLSPSCEGVLKLLWELPEGVDFIQEPLEIKDMCTIKFEQGTMNPWFETIRAACVDILQNRTVRLGCRIFFIGMALRKLMEMDWQQPDLQAWEQYAKPFTQSFTDTDQFTTLPGNHYIFISQNIQTALRLSEQKWAQELIENLGVYINKNNEKAQAKFSISAYDERLDAMEKTLGDLSYFFENLIAAVVMYLCFPNLNSKDEMWKSYVSLCNIYSFYRFASVAGNTNPPTKEGLFHVIVMASRSLLHNKTRRNNFSNEFFENECATLAHMAILLNE